MSRQYFRELQEPVMVVAPSAVAGTAEAALWPVSPYTALAANQLRAGQIWNITAWGIITTAGASPGTLTITPRYGTTTGGTTLGISDASATLAISQTNKQWFLEWALTVRTVGSSGTVSNGGSFQTTPGVLTSGIVFGSATATIDTTAAQGWFLGVTLGSASDSMTTQGVAMEIIN